MRQEIRVTRWLVARGVPPFLATSFLWLAKIMLLVVIGYVFFWLAAVLAIAFVALKVLGHADLDAEPYAWEWRQGFLGLGVYDKSGQRIDPDDPSEND